MNQTRTPQDLSGIIEQTFTLIGSTIARNAVIASLFLALPIILVTITANEFFSFALQMQETGAEDSEGVERLMTFAGSLAPFIIASLLLSLGSLITEVACLQVAAGELNGEPIGYSAAIARTFDGRWLRGLGAELLKMLILAGGFVILGVIAAIFGAFSEGSEGGTGFAVPIILIMFILIIVGVYAAVRWNFSLAAASIENLPPVEALGRTWSLMDGMWWRTAGILLLAGIALQFVTTIISMPFTFGSMFDVYKEFYSVLGAASGKVDPSVFAQLQAQMGTGIGVGIGLTTLVRVTITPAYTAVMFFDLIAREVPPKVIQPFDVEPNSGPTE